jgi:hypothetical protein
MASKTILFTRMGTFLFHSTCLFNEQSAALHIFSSSLYFYLPFSIRRKDSTQIDILIDTYQLFLTILGDYHYFGLTDIDL